MYKGPVIFFYWEGLRGNIRNFKLFFKALSLKKKINSRPPLPTLFKFHPPTLCFSHRRLKTLLEKSNKNVRFMFQRFCDSKSS